MRRLFVLLFSVVTLYGYAGSRLALLYISADTVPCAGYSSCLLARDRPDKEWKVFSQPITGFTQEAGYEYCLLVEVSVARSDPPVPFDSVHFHYVLKEIRSKTKKTDSLQPGVAIIPDSVRWMLYKLRAKDGTKTFSIQKVFIKFNNKAGTITGDTDCNIVYANFTMDSVNLRFDNILTTEIACRKHAIEPEFLQALRAVSRYKLTKDLLYLYIDQSLAALFTRKK
jgi:heat shock protein HslJ